MVSTVQIRLPPFSGSFRSQSEYSLCRAETRAAGMVAVWFERGGSPTLDVGGADAKVHSWGEFRSLVEATC